MVLFGVIMVLVAHGHYTVDVLIAYYVTTRLWYIYHTLANNAHLKVSFRSADSNKFAQRSLFDRDRDRSLLPKI